MKRVLVIGTSGSGKSHLAQRLSVNLGLPFFASDPFYWDPGWKPVPAGRVREQIADVVRREAWTLDGNFDDERDLVWRQADCIIWLDYPLATVLRQVILRNLRWLLTRQTVWSGNRMSLRRALSGIRHAFRSHALKRRNFALWLAGLSGIEIHRFRNSRETETWLQGLCQLSLNDHS